MLSTEQFGFILTLKNSFAFVQSYFEDEQFFLHLNEFYPDISLNDTVAFHYVDAPKGKQISRIRKLDLSSSVKILDNIKGTVTRPNDNRSKFNSVGLIKLDSSSLDNIKEYQQFFDLKFNNILLFATGLNGTSRRIFNKNKKLNFSISQIDSSHLFFIKENITEDLPEGGVSSINNSKEKQFITNVNNMIQSGMKKEYGIISLVKNKEYGFIFCENYPEEIYFRVSDFYYNDIPQVKDNMEVEFFVISEINRGKLSNRAMYLKLIPNNTVEFDIVIKERVKLMILSAPSVSSTSSAPSLHSPGVGELEIPLTLDQIPSDLINDNEKFPLNLFQPYLKYIDIWIKCLPHDKFLCKQGDEFLIDIIYYKPKNCFLARNFKLINFSPFDRDFGIIISSSKFNFSSPNPNYKGDKEKEKENNKIVIFSLNKFLLLQSKENKIYNIDYEELNLIPSIVVNNPTTSNNSEEVIKEVSNSDQDFLLNIGTYVSFDTIYDDKKLVKCVRLKVCTRDEIENEKDNINKNLLLKNNFEIENNDESYNTFYAQTGDKLSDEKDEKKSKKSKSALLNDLKNIIKNNKTAINENNKTLEENLLQYFLMKSFILTPKYLLEKNIKGTVLKKIKNYNTISNDKASEKNFLINDKILLNIIHNSSLSTPSSSSTNSPLSFNDLFGNSTPPALMNHLSSNLSISSKSSSEEIGQIEIHSSNKSIGNLSNYIYYNKCYFNKLLSFLYNRKFSNINSITLILIPSYIYKQYEQIINLFFPQLLKIQVIDSIFYNSNSFNSIRIEKLLSEDDKFHMYTKENYIGTSISIKSVKSMIKKNNSTEINLNELAFSSTKGDNKKKILLTNKKHSDNLLISYHNSDYLTDSHYGPLDNGHEVFFNVYFDPIKNKVMAKEIIMTDEPIPEIGSNTTQIGVLEIILNKQNNSSNINSKVFFNGFIRHIETDEKFYWNNYHFTNSTTLKELKNNSLVSFQVRKRGGLRCAINISNISPSIKKQFENKEDEILDVECLCLMINNQYAIPLDIATGTPIDLKYINISNFSRMIGETLFLNEIGDWKKSDMSTDNNPSNTPATNVVIPDVLMEYKPNYYSPLGREPIKVSFTTVDQPKLSPGDVIKAKLVVNIYKSRSILGLIFSSLVPEIKAIKKKGKVLRTKATLKTLIELKSSRFSSSSYTECKLPSNVYTGINARYNYPSLELIEIQDFDEISTTDRAKLLGGFPSPPYSYYFCLFSDAFILKDVENFIVDEDSNSSSIYIGDSMHYFIIPELYGNFALFPYFETFHDLVPTKLAFSSTTQGISKKVAKPKESTFIPATYAQGPPTENAIGFPGGWMTLNLKDISNRPWSHLLDHLKEKTIN